MLKIRRVVELRTVFLLLSGRICAEDLPDLRELLRAEHINDVVLDLAEVRLVDREAVRFLVECEMQGIRVHQCPAYIREWMARETGLPPD